MKHVIINTLTGLFVGGIVWCVSPTATGAAMMLFAIVGYWLGELCAWAREVLLK